MKKFTVGFLASILLVGGIIFAQSISSDSAEISVKNPIIEGEAVNLSISMMRDGFKISDYTGSIFISIVDESGMILKQSEYTTPNGGVYTFLPTDLGTKEFQKGLEIKKAGNFYIQVEDFNEDIILGKQQVSVIKNSDSKGDYHVNVLSPLPDAIITSDKIDIIANIVELPNSKALVYIDQDQAITINIDANGLINYSIGNIKPGKHSLKIEIPDIDGSILGTSDVINFTTTEGVSVGIKNVSVSPEEGLMVGDKTKITVYTDEMVESVQMKLSDRPDSDSLILTKDGLGEFSYNLYLTTTGEINMSFETFAENNSVSKVHENVQKIHVLDTPEIANVTTVKDDENQSATLAWEVLNGEPVSSYTIKYRAGEGNDISGEEQTEKQTFTFTDVPYDTEINVTITPTRKNALNLPTHGAASKTIQFVISKPSEDPLCGNGKIDDGEDCDTCPEDMGDSCPNAPRCTVQNIATRTTKIGDNYYLIWDKVENVTKYIVYSSPSPDGVGKIKVYETSDTSYEYPFDYTAKEEQFMYFWIVGICDDGEELELTGATKVQVGPAENFFLLLCLTFLIYFGIKLFRQTEE